MKWTAIICALILIIAAILTHNRIRVGIQFIQSRIVGQKTISDRIKEYGPSVTSRLAPHFANAGIQYPPKKITLLAIKSEKRLEVYADRADGTLIKVISYPILAASGELGPKLREGDRQVPEGIYEVELLNPNSLYHLSIRLNYPNEFDQQMAREDNRINLGGDIMIHGSNMSIGCLAMGDEAAEDLFVLTEMVGISNVRVIITPVDLRNEGVAAPNQNSPKWIPQLYNQIKESMKDLQPNKAVEGMAPR